MLGSSPMLIGRPGALSMQSALPSLLLSLGVVFAGSAVIYSRLPPAHAFSPNQNEASGMPRLLLTPVKRLSNPSPAEFVKMDGNSFVQAPLVIEDAMKGSYDPADWTRGGLTRICGNHSMMTVSEPWCAQQGGKGCHSVREVHTSLLGTSWAGLRETNLTEANITTFADFMHAQETNPGLYLHDATINLQCPELLGKFKAPKYFPINIKELKSDPGFNPDDVLMYHPGFFVGRKGTGSNLHSDSSMTRFWLFVMSGRKHVRLIPPSENWAGEVLDKRAFQPLIYGIDLMAPDFDRHPQLQNLVVYDAVINPGELMFIPAGWAHQVANLDDCVATSQNFIDTEAVPMFLRSQLDELSDQDMCESDEAYTKYQTWLDYQDKMTAFYLPILQPVQVNDNLRWDEYFSLHLLEHAPVPSTVVEFVSSRQRGPPTGPPQDPNFWADVNGRSPLHVATRHNFVSVVKYLIEVGGIDPDLLDTRGMSALAIAFDLQYRILWDYLTSIGARSYRFGEPEMPAAEAGKVE